MVFRCLDFLRLLICYLVADVEWFAMKKILLQFVLGSTKICLSFTGLSGNFATLRVQCHDEQRIMKMTTPRPFRKDNVFIGYQIMETAKVTKNEQKSPNRHENRAIDRI